MSDAALVVAHPEADALTQESGEGKKKKEKNKKNVLTTDALDGAEEKKKIKPQGASLTQLINDDCVLGVRD